MLRVWLRHLLVTQPFARAQECSMGRKSGEHGGMREGFNTDVFEESLRLCWEGVGPQPCHRAGRYEFSPLESGGCPSRDCEAVMYSIALNGDDISPRDHAVHYLVIFFVLYGQPGSIGREGRDDDVTADLPLTRRAQTS